MAVSDMVAEAWKAVKDAGIPEPLQEVAFKEAMAVLAGRPVSGPSKQRVQEAGRGSRPNRPTAGAKAGTRARPKREPATNDVIGTVLPDDELFDKFSDETAIPRHALEEVFYFDGGKPILNGPARQLGDNVAAQARAVAVALTAAYHYALDVRDVPASKIADECKRLKCWDTDNFSAYISKEKAINYVGPRGKKVFRVKQPDTVEGLTLVVNRIRGVES
jgi:hypothetical protein